MCKGRFFLSVYSGDSLLIENCAVSKVKGHNICHLSCFLTAFTLELAGPTVLGMSLQSDPTVSIMNNPHAPTTPSQMFISLKQTCI